MSGFCRIKYLEFTVTALGDCQRDAAIPTTLRGMDYRLIMFSIAVILVGLVTAKVLLAPTTQAPMMVDCQCGDCQ
jgi:hypothetical protein